MLSTANLASRWRGQSVAYSSRPLTTLLCYDRVVVPYRLLQSSDTLKRLGQHFHYGMWLTTAGDLNDLSIYKVMLSGFRLGGNQGLLEVAALPPGRFSVGDQVREVERWTGASVISVSDSRAEYEQILKRGSREVVVASLSNLDIVDESALTLPQVVEFRRDRDAAVKYRRLLSWLNAEVAQMSAAAVSEHMEQRLEDYSWAVKKHGIKTAIGAVSEVLEGKYLLGASAVTTAVLTAGFPELSLLAGAGVVVGRVGVRIAADWLELQDRKRGENSEVAWLYETRKHFS